MDTEDPNDPARIWRGIANGLAISLPAWLLLALLILAPA